VNAPPGIPLRCLRIAVKPGGSHIEVHAARAGQHPAVMSVVAEMLVAIVALAGYQRQARGPKVPG
jgi:hypothetical protein